VRTLAHTHMRARGRMAGMAGVMLTWIEGGDQEDPTKKKKALCRYDFFQQVGAPPDPRHALQSGVRCAAYSG
jgi:hypothetical protein